jgi:hypothetical protein
MMRILPGDLFGFIQAARKHDVNTILAVGRRARKQQAPGSMLIVEPTAVIFIIGLLGLFLFRQ